MPRERAYPAPLLPLEGQYYIHQFITYVRKREARSAHEPPKRRSTTVGDIARRFFMTCAEVQTEIRAHEERQWGAGKVARLSVSDYVFTTASDLPDRHGPRSALGGFALFAMAEFHPIEDQTAPLSRRLVILLEDTN